MRGGWGDASVGLGGASSHIVCDVCLLSVLADMSHEPSPLQLYLLLLSAVTHAPFHAPVLRPTSWPNARERRDGEVN